MQMIGNTTFRALLLLYDSNYVRNGDRQSPIINYEQPICQCHLLAMLIVYVTFKVVDIIGAY